MIKNNPWIAPIVFALVGIILLSIDVLFIKETTDFLASSKNANGEVVEMIRSFGSKGRMLFSPKVSFNDENGRQIFFVSNTSSSSPFFNVGEKVPVLYNPLIPEDAKINTFLEVWFPVLFFSLFGLICTLIGVFWIISKFKNKNSDPKLKS